MKKQFIVFAIMATMLFYSQSFAVTVENPYATVTNWTPNGGNLHAHIKYGTTGKYPSCSHNDAGSISLDQLKSHFVEYGYWFLATTCQSKCALCYNAPDAYSPNYDIFSVKATEIVNCTQNGAGSNHVVSLFNYVHPVTSGGILTLEGIMNKVNQTTGALAFIAHPGRYKKPADRSKYYGCLAKDGCPGWIDLFNKSAYTNTLLGVEVTSSYPVMQATEWSGFSQWDSILTNVPYSRRVLGFADDDSHYGDGTCLNGFEDRGGCFNMFPGIFSDDQATAVAALKNQIKAGAFYFSFVNGCGVFPPPILTGVTVSNGVITISVQDQANSGITWITNSNPDGIHDNEWSIDCKQLSGQKFVRAWIWNGLGSSFTQAFQLH